MKYLRWLHASWLRLLNVMDEDWLADCHADGLDQSLSISGIRAEIEERRCRIIRLEAM